MSGTLVPGRPTLSDGKAVCLCAHLGEWIMAYIDFAQPLPAVGDGTTLSAVADRIRGAAPAPTTASTSALTTEEWQVVHLARNDGLASLRDTGGGFSLHDFIFGRQPRLPLASERLETLRRIAVDAWHNGFAVHPSAIAAFRNAGFSEGQLETLLTAITAARHQGKAA